MPPVNSHDVSIDGPGCWSLIGRKKEGKPMKGPLSASWLPQSEQPLCATISHHYVVFRQPSGPKQQIKANLNQNF